MKVINGATTIKEMIEKKYYSLSYKEFQKQLNKNREFYKLERMFLKLLFHFKPTWDIEIQVFLLADTYELTNMDFFGVIQRLNPQPESIITGIQFRELIHDGEFLFNSVSINSITHILRR